MSVDKYLNVITSEHRQQPKYTAMLSALLSPADDVQNLLDLWTYIFDLESAEGDALDKLGERVGCFRKLELIPVGHPTVTLEDDYYRICIMVKILNNQWDGTIESLIQNFDSMFPDYSLTVVDNQDMTMKLIVEGVIDDLMLHLMTAGYLLPKPAGVRLEIVIRQRQEDSTTLYTGVALKLQHEIEIDGVEAYLPNFRYLVDEDGNYLVDENDDWLGDY